MGEESEAFATTAPLAPVTGERKVRNDLEETLPKPCKYLLKKKHVVHMPVQT